ncbi:MAG: TonB-dependent receptor [Desulfuromonadaceae bacterium]|nr:TonB-dependent receptor [Desulfuromonadaceae bacterium]MDD5107733.1 TonB-dependent receptor [Desulfuromonadaceae bacterium]
MTRTSHSCKPPVIVRILCLVAPLLFFLTVTASANQSPEIIKMDSLLNKNLEELVEVEISLATGSPKQLKVAPSVATVITAEDIERLGVTTLDEALETVPGLHVIPSATNIFTSIWSIRGIYSQLNPQVLLLVNGQPMRNNTNGNKPYGLRIPSSIISRIEILRGPGSAVHGADAFAGTINVITKSSSDIAGTSGGVRVGSFDSHSYRAEHGGSYGEWEIAAGVEYLKSGGDQGRVIERDALGSGSPSMAPGPLDTHYEELTTHLSAARNGFTSRLFYNEVFESGHGPGVSQTLTGDGTSKGRQFLGSLSYKSMDILPDFNASVTLSGSYLLAENWFRFFPQAYRNMVGVPEGEDLNGGLELTGDYHGISHHQLRVAGGMNYYNTDTSQHKNFGPGVSEQFGPLVDISNTPYVYLTEHNRTLLFAALQDEWNFAEGWELTAGVRLDDYSDFGSAINPRLALVWNTTPELTTKLLYGRAFRPPTFGEQYFQNNPATLGNRNLDPETLDSLELVFDYRPVKTLRLGLNIFGYRVKGMIDYVADPPPATTKTAQNARDQEGCGGELEADWKVLETLRLRGNFAYQNSVDKATDHAVPDTPGMKLYADVDWAFLPRWSTAAQYLWIGDRHRAAGDLRADIGNYDLVNLTVRRKDIMKHWDISFAVRNLFDRSALEPSDPKVPGDYPLEGRSFWTELRFTF